MACALPNSRRPQWVVFSDLDASLLDADDYSCQHALGTLHRLQARGIPLVFCTSKTRAEVEPIRARLGNRDPFVVESGGAVHVPVGYFPEPFDHDEADSEYLTIGLGAPYAAMVAELDRLKQLTGAALRGFSDMTVHEVAARCNLTMAQAASAKRRHWDEPFLILDPSMQDAVVAAADRPLPHGGRFFHLARSDKGRGVATVLRLMRRFRGAVTSVGIGDSANDLPMLRAVDLPVLLGSGCRDAPDDRYKLRRVDQQGPEGWAIAVGEILDDTAPAIHEGDEHCQISTH